MSGMELHANILATLADGIQLASPWWPTCLALLLGGARETAKPQRDFGRDHTR